MRFIPGPSRRGSVRLRVGLTTLAASTLFGALGATSRPLDAVLRNGPGVVNHPVGVRPSAGVRVPPGWPLASDGTLTCKTCHSRLPEISGASDAYLRDSQTGAAPSMHFCAKCHEADTANAASPPHWLAFSEAHVMPDDGESLRSRGAPDRESRRCLDCHDGVSAAEAHHSTGALAGTRGDFMRRSHPVGVPYDEAHRRAADAPYRHRSLLPRQVRLPQGCVSCVSCHDLYARDEHRLSVPIERSQLCLACHAMD